MKHRTLMIYLIIQSFIWVFTSFTYYGMTLGTSVMVGNRFVNFMLSAVVELPSYLVTQVLITCFGRRPTMILAYSLTGVSLVAANLIPEKSGRPLYTVSQKCVTEALRSI
ncbi:putative transporter B0252.3 [Tubulanus polymorphus]|uniref:putative transporter B0252.3 n=1 Tax=Tubulanus polymorphus TaxID=672921 RepID=UPI003DA25D51